MVWTAIAAVVLAVLGRVADPTPGPIELIDRVMFAAAYGLALGAVFVTIAQQWRGNDFPTEPGEFYLVATGIGDSLLVASWTARATLDFPTRPAMLWGFYLAFVLRIIPDYWAALRVTVPGWSQLMWVRLGLRAAQAVLIAGRFEFDMLNAYWQAAGIEVLVTVCWLPILWWRDRRRHIHRGWFHNVGALCWFLTCLQALAQWLLVYVQRA